MNKHSLTAFLVFDGGGQFIDNDYFDYLSNYLQFGTLDLRIKIDNMSDINPDWTREELKIYLLLYSANADLLESEEELDLIRAKTTTSNFEKIHTEFKADNDYQSIQKIQSATGAYGYTKKDITNLLSEMKEVFLSDGKYDLLEQNLFRMLNHILS